MQIYLDGETSPEIALPLGFAGGLVDRHTGFVRFGNKTMETSPEIALPLGFAGGFVDRHTGFVRFGFRDYDPQVGRFTAKDPIGYTGGDHDLYDYCVDDPVSFVDPEGLKEKAVGKATNHAPFFIAHKDKALKESIIRAVQGKKDAGYTESLRNSLKEAVVAIKDTVMETVKEVISVPAIYRINQQGHKETVEDVKSEMKNILEPYGKNLLGTHLTIINHRTRGVSDAIIEKDITNITDSILEKTGRKTLKHKK